MSKDIKNLVVLGAPGAGKGFLGTTLNKTFGAIMSCLSMGALVVKRLAKELPFKDKYGHLVEKGELLPDSEMVEMGWNGYKELLLLPQTRLIYMDGVFRTRGQVAPFIKSSTLNPSNTVVVELRALESTCRRRYKERADKLIGGRRSDNNSFDHRFGLYFEHVPVILEKFHIAGIRILTIDANEDLETIVIPRVVSIAQKFCPISTSAHADPHNSFPSTRNDIAGMTPAERIYRVHAMRTGSQPAHQMIG